MLHIYTGTGKGKTTAAAGLAIRAAGWGRQVVFTQFLKGTPSGEIRSLRTLGVRVLRDESTGKFLYQMNDEEKAAFRSTQERLFCQAWDEASGAGLLVLDEIGDAVATGMIEEKLLREKIAAAPKELEIVLTGRGFSDALLAAADYISEIKCLRHPYERGISARKGIEF